MIYKTQKQLDAALAYWQKVLRLQDWDIEAKLVTPGDAGYGSEGTCLINVRHKCASIKVMNDKHRTAVGYSGEADNEDTLVHELLHIHLELMAPDDDGSLDYELFEQTVDVLADCFVKLKRQLSNK